jgi:hypothetical protein
MSNTNSSSPESNSNDKQETKNKTETFDNKKAYELVSQWYQAYYLWTTTVMSSALLNPSLLAQGVRVITPASSQMNDSGTTQLLENSQSASPNIPFVQSSQQQQQRVQQQQINPIVFYKVPTLFKRMAAELFDAFCIQLLKIGIALLIINYTEIM